MSYVPCYPEGLTNLERYDTMSTMFKRIAIGMVLFFALASQAHAFWIWTPKDKKFVNPKWTAEDTPQKQLERAKEILEAREHKKALIEFKALLRHYPEAYEAAEAQFSIGTCLEKMGKLYEAYLAYQKVIDKYPFSDTMNAVLKKQFEIANTLTETEAKILGISFPQQYYAIEIYRKIIDNYPYGELAPLSQYKIGLVLKSLGSFTEAKGEFEKVVSAYPESEWLEPAKYQVAECASLASLNAEYDQALSNEARERFEEFIEKHPDAELSEATRQQIQNLTDKEAEKDFTVAQFYEKQKEYPSAEIYYQGIVKKHPQSIWAEKSRERIRSLRKEDKI